MGRMIGVLEVIGFADARKDPLDVDAKLACINRTLLLGVRSIGSTLGSRLSRSASILSAYLIGRLLLHLQDAIHPLLYLGNGERTGPS